MIGYSSRAYTSGYHKLFVWHHPRGFYSFTRDITLNHVCTRIPTPRANHGSAPRLRWKGRGRDIDEVEQTKKSARRRESVSEPSEREDENGGGRLGLSGKMLPFHSRKEEARREKRRDGEGRSRQEIREMMPPSICYHPYETSRQESTTTRAR